jgi:hypothetical protein
MSQLSDLRKDVLKMSHSERLDKLREIREDRIVSKTHKTKRVAGQKKRVSTLGKRIESLSPEERLKLVAMLEAEDGDQGT